MGNNSNNKTFGIGLGQVAGAVGGGIMGAIGANSQHRRQKELMDKQFNNQSRLNRQGHQMQKDMWEFTNYPNQVKMMLEAGLSPAMMYGGSGAGGTTAGGQGGGSATGGSATAMDVGAMVNMARQGAEIDLLKAQRDKTINESDNLKQEWNNIYQEGKRLWLANMWEEWTRQDEDYNKGNDNELVGHKTDKGKGFGWTEISPTSTKAKQDFANKDTMLQELANLQVEQTAKKEGIELTKEQARMIYHKILQGWANTGIQAIGAVQLRGIIDKVLNRGKKGNTTSTRKVQQQKDGTWLETHTTTHRN